MFSGASMHAHIHSLFIIELKGNYVYRHQKSCRSTAIYWQLMVDGGQAISVYLPLRNELNYFIHICNFICPIDFDTHNTASEYIMLVGFIDSNENWHDIEFHVIDVFSFGATFWASVSTSSSSWSKWKCWVHVALFDGTQASKLYYIRASCSTCKQNALHFRFYWSLSILALYPHYYVMCGCILCWWCGIAAYADEGNDWVQVLCVCERQNLERERKNICRKSCTCYQSKYIFILCIAFPAPYKSLLSHTHTHTHMQA